MRKFIVLFVIILFTASFTYAQKQITTFILLRHAEKGNDGTDDPDLKPEGKERANHLAELLGKTSIDAIYSTSFKRTRDTVAPLAAAKALDVQPYEAFKEEEIEKMLRKYAGGTVVISGHSNNIPWIANLLIGKEEYKDYEDSDYKNLLIVSVVEKGKVAKVTWLSY